MAFEVFRDREFFTDADQPFYVTSADPCLSRLNNFPPFKRSFANNVIVRDPVERDLPRLK